jgi:hypothetical protein
MKRRLSCAAAALGLAAAPAAASAEAVGSNYQGFSRVQRGVFELGFENLLLLRQNSVDLSETTTRNDLDVVYTVGLTPRYFVIDNLALGINVNYFLRKLEVETETEANGQKSSETQTTDDAGFIGFVMANYYMRLGNSFFFKPGVGAGGFTGTRERPGDPANPSVKLETSLTGVAGKLDLGFAFYASRSFNLKAGVDVVFRSGQEKPEEGDARDFTSLDAGFNVGAAYVF